MSSLSSLEILWLYSESLRLLSTSSGHLGLCADITHLGRLGKP